MLWLSVVKYMSYLLYVVQWMISEGHVEDLHCRKEIRIGNISDFSRSSRTLASSPFTANPRRHP